MFLKAKKALSSVKAGILDYVRPEWCKRVVVTTDEVLEALEFWDHFDIPMHPTLAKMRELRKAAGARTIWGSSGQIIEIVYGDKTYCMYGKNCDEGARLAGLYQADKILLGD